MFDQGAKPFGKHVSHLVELIGRVFIDGNYRRFDTVLRLGHPIVEPAQVTLGVGPEA
ncbi:MAG: hypothetical protein HY901_03105 [Deltaproteobacteria bacterium]|nr:hypothetical protein [Deltaproteobacteria bacterium]